MKGGYVVFMEEQQHYEIRERDNQSNVISILWAISGAIWLSFGIAFIVLIMLTLAGSNVIDYIASKIIGG